MSRIDAALVSITSHTTCTVRCSTFGRSRASASIIATL
jgi:hypothetical protein